VSARRRASGTLAALLALAAPARAQDVDTFAEMDIMTGGSGVVVLVVHEGSLDFEGVWGTVAQDSEGPLTSSHLFPLPALVPSLIATTARALAAAGVLDLDAPLRVLVPGVSPALADATLDQLLGHRAGLDDAAPAEGFDWQAIITDLPAGARMLEPGRAFSTSRYSYPVVAAVVERATRLGLAEVLERAVFGPLGMVGSTFDAERARELGMVTGYVRDPETGEETRAPDPSASGPLPLLYTTVADVAQFASAWVGGGLAGGAPGPDSGDAPAARSFHDGVWLGDFRGVPVARLAGDSLGFAYQVEILPRSGTVLISLKNGGTATLTTAMVRDRIAEALGLPAADSAAARGTPPEGSPPDAEWAGTYRNGNLMMVLRPGVDGRMVLYAGREDLELRAVGRDRFQAFTPRNEPTSLVFELRTLDSDRILVLADRVYLQEPPLPAP
jgi:CubicO group peptidase (beta-lactamase class C family)